MALWNKNMPYGATDRDCRFINKRCLDMYKKCDVCQHNIHNKQTLQKSYCEPIGDNNYTCENCGKEYKSDQWFGCCSCDCYIGRIRGHSTEQFLELVGTMRREANKYI